MSSLLKCNSKIGFQFYGNRIVGQVKIILIVIRPIEPRDELINNKYEEVQYYIVHY